VLRHGDWTSDQVLAIGDSFTEYDAARELGMPFAGIVAPGEENPFPPEIPVWTDMAAFDAAWRESETAGGAAR
jgi:hypothetical protein